jgi:hypothetical protein
MQIPAIILQHSYDVRHLHRENLPRPVALNAESARSGPSDSLHCHRTVIGVLLKPDFGQKGIHQVGPILTPSD